MTCEGKLEMRHGRLAPYVDRDWVQTRNLGCFLVSKDSLPSKAGAGKPVCRLNPALMLKMVFMDFK